MIDIQKLVDCATGLDWELKNTPYEINASDVPGLLREAAAEIQRLRASELALEDKLDVKAARIKDLESKLRHCAGMAKAASIAMDVYAQEIQEPGS